MKYLYKGMALPGWGDVSGSVLLGWHEKVRHPQALRMARLADLERHLVDGGGGYWLYCTSDDGQADCINLKGMDCTILEALDILTFLPSPR